MKSIIRTSRFFFYQNEQGLLHRTDGPAREWKSGIKEWYINGERHRTDGPAIEMNNGDNSWYSLWENHEVIT